MRNSLLSKRANKENAQRVGGMEEKEKELYNCCTPATERGRSKVLVSAPSSFLQPLLLSVSASGYDTSITGSSIQKNKVIFFLFAKRTGFLLAVQTNSSPWLIPVSCAEDISLCMDQIVMKQSSLLRKEHFPFFLQAFLFTIALV